MEIDYLISMTDFVLKQYKKWENNSNICFERSERYISETVLYASFLKQKLEPYMFVPCKKVNGKWVFFLLLFFVSLEH